MTNTFQPLTRFRAALAISALGLAFSTTPANAAMVAFNTAPFAGTTALTDPGRQVVGNEVSLNNFDVNADQFAFDLPTFGVGSLNFFNGFASGLPSSGINVIALRDSDNDNNPATAFNAGSAANLIAERLTTDGPGFFLYFNSSLNVNRLVYSTNLNAADADLKILARILNPTGVGAIDALPTFGEANFVATPEPGTAYLVFAAAALAAGFRLKKQR